MNLIYFVLILFVSLSLLVNGVYAFTNSTSPKSENLEPLSQTKGTGVNESMNDNFSKSTNQSLADISGVIFPPWQSCNDLNTLAQAEYTITGTIKPYYNGTIRYFDLSVTKSNDPTSGYFVGNSIQKAVFNTDCTYRLLPAPSSHDSFERNPPFIACQGDFKRANYEIGGDLEQVLNLTKDKPTSFSVTMVNDFSEKMSVNLNLDDQSTPVDITRITTKCSEH